jgi:hypothetical protein
MFYGEGAGTRRKLIKAKVDARSAKDPAYKKAFDHHVANTDMGKRAEQARSQRSRKDAANYVAKTGRGVKRMVAPAAGTVAALGIATYITNPAFRSGINGLAKTSYKSVKEAGKAAWKRESVKTAFKAVWRSAFPDLP